MQGYRGGEESEIIIRLIMGAQVHHRCKSTGETFTEAGWKKWLKSHDPSKAVTEFSSSPVGRSSQEKRPCASAELSKPPFHRIPIGRGSLLV